MNYWLLVFKIVLGLALSVLALTRANLHSG